jgi:hypothetical protein
LMGAGLGAFAAVWHWRDRRGRDIAGARRGVGRIGRIFQWGRALGVLKLGGGILSGKVGPCCV